MGYKHGDSKTKLYNLWKEMRARCSPGVGEGPRKYYDRGIRVTGEWSNWLVFKAWALNHGYRPGLQLERKDNDGNYCPENCVFATPTVQARNTSRTKWITYDGETKSLAEWCEQLGLPYNRTADRINKLGWSINDAFQTNRR